MLADIETSIFYFFNRACHNPLLDFLMPVLTEMGSGEFLFVLALCMLLSRRSRVKVSSVILMAGVTFSYNTVKVLKHLIARPRPHAVLTDVTMLLKTGDFAFPSGHTTMAFMAAFVLTKCFGRWYIFYTIATVVAISRIYCGAHFPLDVASGACLGMFIGYILVYAVSNTTIYKEG